MDSKKRNKQLREAGVKKSLWRLNLEREARNDCNPPLEIEKMMNMTNRELFEYIAEHQIKDEQYKNLNLFDKE